MKKLLPVLMMVVIIGLVLIVLRTDTKNSAPVPEPVVVPEVVVQEELNTSEQTGFTERYAAKVDRVNVVFEHKDFTRYKLTTNDLVREGELNTERGFEDDIDATVYVLNWQQPEGQQMFYVRLTDEPGLLYALDGDRKILRGSVLKLQE